MRELFHEILSSLRNNKLRTALTGFAVSWGIFLLIALLGAGNGLMNSFMGNMDSFISQTVNVEGWYTSEPYAGYQANRKIELTEKDVAYTAGKDWDGIIYDVSRTTQGRSDTLSLNGITVSAYIEGVTPEYQEKNKIRMAFGRFINKADLEEMRKVAVIPMDHAKELSPKNPEEIIGRWVNASGVAFKVVGISHQDERDWRRLTAIPYTTYKGLYDASDKVESITFSLNGPKTLQEHLAFEEEYGSALKRRHDIAPTDDRGLWIMNGYKENLQMNKASSIIRIALWILGILTLISGIVGISNIMLITVKERTHEFGIRKAIGAKPRSIMTLIIAESVTITGMFGYIGMLLGMVACQVMEMTVGQHKVDLGMEQIQMLVNPSVGVDVALEATLLLIVAGTIAGAIPAWKAAKVKPIEALRAE